VRLLSSSKRRRRTAPETAERLRREFGQEQISGLGSRASGDDLARRFDAVRERHRRADGLQPVGQALERDVDAAEKQQPDEQQVVEHGDVAPAEADRSHREPECGAGERAGEETVVQARSPPKT